MSKTFKTSFHKKRLRRLRIYKINPKGKMILLPFILNPNYQDITHVKTQIRWCEETARYYLREDFDYFLFKENIELADSLRKNLKKLVR
jgi:hypothetical protein